MQESANSEQLDDDGTSVEKHGNSSIEVKKIIDGECVDVETMTSMSSNNRDSRGPRLLLCCHGVLLLLQALNCHL